MPSTFLNLWIYCTDLPGWMICLLLNLLIIPTCYRWHSWHTESMVSTSWKAWLHPSCLVLVLLVSLFLTALTNLLLQSCTAASSSLLALLVSSSAHLPAMPSWRSSYREFFSSIYSIMSVTLSILVIIL